MRDGYCDVCGLGYNSTTEIEYRLRLCPKHRERKPKMPEFIVPVRVTYSGMAIVEAPNVEEAESVAANPGEWVDFILNELVDAETAGPAKENE